MDILFSENLSKLRKERGLNQRKAAAELKISQALLSHYENGIREPGLDFVIRVCEYYNVSADYMLGLTNVRETILSGGNESSEIASEIKKQEVISIAAALFRVLLQTNEAVALSSLNYMSAAQYSLLRCLFAGSENDQFSLPLEQAAALSEVEMKLLALKLREEIKKSGIKLSVETLRKNISKTTYKTYEAAISKLEDRLGWVIRP